MYCTTPSGTRYQTGSPAPALAALGRGDRQRGDLQDGHPVRGDALERRGVHLVAGPGAAHEVRELEQLVGVAPGEDLGERVGAGDEVQLGVGQLAARGRAACRWCTSDRRGRCPPGRPRTAGWTRSRSPSSGSGPRPAVTSRSAFCQGWPVGTKTTSSRSNQDCTSLAATRWPWWIGSNVPPITPTRRAGVPSGLRASPGWPVSSGVVASPAEGEQADQHDQSSSEDAAADDPGGDAGPAPCSAAAATRSVEQHGTAYRAGIGRPIRPSRASDDALRTISAVAIAAPSHTQPVTSSSTANNDELTALPGFDQFHSQIGRSTT